MEKWFDPVTWFTLVLAVANILLWLTTRGLVREARLASSIAQQSGDAAVVASMPILSPSWSIWRGFILWACRLPQRLLSLLMSRLFLRISARPRDIFARFVLTFSCVNWTLSPALILIDSPIEGTSL